MPLVCIKTGEIAAHRGLEPDRRNDNAVEAPDDAGTVVRMAHQIETPVVGDIVRFTTTYISTGWDGPKASRSTLRFVDTNALSRYLSEADLEIEEQFGDWAEGPLTETSPEIITIARRI